MYRVSHLTTLVNTLDLDCKLCYPIRMEILYGITEVAKLLGVSRQQAHNRRKKEGWAIADDGESIPASAVKKSRDLERDKLLQRVDELDALNSKQQVSDAIKMMQQEQDL